MSHETYQTTESISEKEFVVVEVPFGEEYEETEHDISVGSAQIGRGPCPGASGPCPSRDCPRYP